MDDRSTQDASQASSDYYRAAGAGATAAAAAKAEGTALEHRSSNSEADYDSATYSISSTPTSRIGNDSTSAYGSSENSYRSRSPVGHFVMQPLKQSVTKRASASYRGAMP